MTEEALIRCATGMIRGSRTYEADARKNAAGSNSKVGGVLALATQAPRQIAEAAVCAASIRMDREGGAR